jgi:hypothetical protein
MKHTPETAASSEPSWGLVRVAPHGVLSADSCRNLSGSRHECGPPCILIMRTVNDAVRGRLDEWEKKRALKTRQFD